LSEDRLHYNLVLVGGSTSNFALAHKLVQLAKESGQKISIAILEKSREFGGHIVSGAVSKPHIIEKLFPDYLENGFPTEGVCQESFFSVMGSKAKWDVPRPLMPEEFKKEGYLILTLSYVISWMANRLKEVIKEIPNVTIDFYPGFAAHETLYEGNKVVGVRVAETGSPEDDYIYADVVAYGDKGFISQDVIKKFNLRPNPQLWSVGVKETWEVQGDYAGKVWHTMGYPMLDGSFAGGFVYGMKNNKLTIGLIISLDSPNPNINPQQRLQDLKKHPWLQSMLQDGRLLKYGAALLPEGGYFSLPSKFAVEGALFLGDALGTLNQRKLAGVDTSMECGYQAAIVLHEAFQKADFSQTMLNQYQARLNETFVIKELYENRYFREAFTENTRLLSDYLPIVAQSIDEGAPLLGPLKVGLKYPFKAPLDALRVVALFNGQSSETLRYKACHTHIKPDFNLPRMEVNTAFQKDTVYTREDAVFYASTKYHEENNHIEEFDAAVCTQCIHQYDSLGKETPCVSDCTAEVHRIDELEEKRHHGMSLENCVQCRTCEIVCPQENLRVKPAFQGSGPDFLGL
jgi:electron-transferring-flavoprotein dehydrogenase